MALTYYDDVVAEKLKRWTPSTSELRILKPSETRRFFELNADDTNDSNLKLPCIALSRNNDVELLLNIANSRSWDGVRLIGNEKETEILNMIPVKLTYQLDIFAKTFEQADEYLRQYLFKLINNPKIEIQIPYRGKLYSHIAYIRVASTVSDTSDISEHLFAGQFTRWTINMEIIDAFLFDIQYKDNWRFVFDEDDVEASDLLGQLEVVQNLELDNKDDFSEEICIYQKKEDSRYT